MQYPDFASAFGAIADMEGPTPGLVPVVNDPKLHRENVGNAYRSSGKRQGAVLRFEGIGRSAFYAKVVLRLLYQAGLASA
jgi:hypothetical protein